MTMSCVIAMCEYYPVIFVVLTSSLSLWKRLTICYHSESDWLGVVLSQNVFWCENYFYLLPSWRGHRNGLACSFVHLSISLYVHLSLFGVMSMFAETTPQIYFTIGKYCKTSNIRCTLVGNKIVDHSDVVGASPVGAAPTTSSFST